MRYIIGNWKSNKTLPQALEWFDQFASLYKPTPDTTVVVATPFVFLPTLKEKLDQLSLEQVSLASQDVSAFPYGAYTGAVTAEMIKDYVDFAIVGHSERREYFHETHQDVANKVSRLKENGIRPVVCVDGPYASEQLSSLENGNDSQMIIAYEPLEAIGSGNPANPAQVTEVVGQIKTQVPDVPVIYGGSTNDENAAVYLQLPGVSGLLPGSASLKPDVFARMCMLSLD